jgi:predicted GTPase
MIVVDGDGAMASQARSVIIAVIGQVKAGKSSLINALLGDRRAYTDVIPATRGISRYELRAPNGSKLVLLDTVGYNQAGPDADQFDDTVEAAREADLIFFVTHARNPGRDADVKLWHDLKDYFTDRPELKMPPALVVMTHVDLLSPVMEWAPPYDWHHPTRPKEKNIAEAAQVVMEQLGDGFAAIVPVCSAEGKTWGIKEELVPEMVGLLGEARAVSFVRCLEAEADEGQIRLVFDQLLAAGKALLGSLRK